MIDELRIDLRAEWMPSAMTPSHRDLTEGIRCPAGRVLVEMALPKERIGSIYLAVETSGNMRPDIGYVIARGQGVSLWVGDIVVVRAGDGTWRKNVEWGPYKAEQVRSYGVWIDPKRPGVPHLFGWWDSILATWDPMSEELRPTEDNLLVERAVPVNKTVGGVHIPENAQKRSGEATIVKVGPRCKEFSSADIGKTILYHPRGVRREIDLVGYGEHLAFLREDAVEAILS